MHAPFKILNPKVSQLTDKKIVVYTVSPAFYNRHQAQPSHFMGPRRWSTCDRLVHSFKSSSFCHYQHYYHHHQHYHYRNFHRYHRHFFVITMSIINVICIFIFVIIVIITSSSSFGSLSLSSPSSLSLSSLSPSSLSSPLSLPLSSFLSSSHFPSQSSLISLHTSLRKCFSFQLFYHLLARDPHHSSCDLSKTPFN